MKKNKCCEKQIILSNFLWIIYNKKRKTYKKKYIYIYIEKGQLFSRCLFIDKHASDFILYLYLKGTMKKNKSHENK